MASTNKRSIYEQSRQSLVAGSNGFAELRKSTTERFEIRTYRDHEELLRDPRIEWIVIATTTNWHREWVFKAIGYGKNLIIEKPIALTLEEAEQNVSALDREQVRITVSNSRRWDADFLFVRKVLAEGRLGEVYRIESRYTDFDSGWEAWGTQGEQNPWTLKKA